MADTLFELIDLADATGFGTLVIPSYYIGKDLPKVRADALREVLESALYSQPLLTLKLSRLKRWVKDIEASASVGAGGEWHIRLNLARLFLLPGDNPAAELAELRGFFEAMKPFFEANAHRRSDIQLTNNRNRKGAVYGKLSCRVEGKDHMDADAEHTGKLVAMVDNSTVLQAFLRNVAMALQRIGPWSWLCLDEDHLYGKYGGPWSQAFMAGLRKKTA
jgi:hypothetical protein